jgi:predicted RNA-binding Zn ribbon-like protein
METTPHDHAVDLETAIEFVNTLELGHDEPTDQLGTTVETLDWLHAHGLIHDEAVAARAGDDATRRHVARTRAALRELADAAFERRQPARRAIDEVNRALRAREVVQLIPGADGLRLDHLHVGDPIDDALANLVEPIVREIAGGHPDRIRACASETCRWIFYDDSRSGRRRWCDMATCGNRAKAARHRARARSEPVRSPAE